MRSGPGVAAAARIPAKKTAQVDDSEKSIALLHGAIVMKIRWKLLLILVLPAAICVAQAWQTTGVPEGDRIVAETHASTEAARLRYAQAVASADADYEKTCRSADKQRSRNIAAARQLAADRLAALAARLTREGKLGKALGVYRVAYSFDQQSAEVRKALTTAGIKLASIPVEIDEYRLAKPAVRGDRVVLWNTHNATHNTSGALRCNVVLLHRRKEVWRQDDVNVVWRRGEDSSTSVALPSVAFTSVKVEITRWQGYSGGLAEVEVWKAGRNIALKRPARASESLDARCGPLCVTDGITSSGNYKRGYWLLPDNRAGWVEVNLAGPQIGVARTCKVLAFRQWQPIARVSRGDILDITAKGTWRAGPQLSADADGGMHQFYLQGRIGGKAFRIGSKHTLRVEADGILEVGMHERSPELYANNSGFLEVSVTLRGGGESERDMREGSVPFE